MIRFLLRFTGFWLLAGGFVALIVDGTRSIASSALIFTATGDAWFAIAPDSFEKAEQTLSEASPTLWSYAGEPALALPLFAVLIALGVLLLSLGQVRERSRFEVA